MNRTAAILAGGESSRLSTKALIPLAGKPMILHIIDGCRKVVDEILVVVNSQDQAILMSRAVDKTGSQRIVIDRKEDFSSPLLGTRTAFENSKGKLTLLLPCDTPLIRQPILELLFTVIAERDAVIPRYPSGHIEPLHAVYRTNVSLKAVIDTISSGKRSMRDLIIKLNTIYLSTNVIRQLDPELDSFANVNTPRDLRIVGRKIAQRSS